MSEEKKGTLKMTFEMEMNKELMDVVKEAMQNMPKMHWKMPSTEEK